MMTSQTERLMGEGTGQVMKYEQESVHKMLMAAQNAIVSIAKKVKDNVLCVVTMLVIAPQSTMLQIPVANPLHALLRANSALIIK